MSESGSARANGHVITAYAQRVCATVGVAPVFSPLGAWLLVALASPAAEGAARARLELAMGLDADAAVRIAGELLRSPPPALRAGAAVWCSPDEGGVELERWLGSLPVEVEHGAIPDQAGADEWAAAHTGGLVDRFPLPMENVSLVLANALATDVNWNVPFELASAQRIDQGGDAGDVLEAPRAHAVRIVDTDAVGPVALHAVDSADGLVVVSVIAEPGADPAGVMSVAHELADRVVQFELDDVAMDLFELPLGEGPAWSINEHTEHTYRQARYEAYLRPWTASSSMSLRAFPGVDHALDTLAALTRSPLVDATQTAIADYHREGFRAAAVSGMMTSTGQPPRSRVRTAVVTFNHPYAVVAIAGDRRSAAHWSADRSATASPWWGVPVFAAWVTPEPFRIGPRGGRGRSDVAL